MHTTDEKESRSLRMRACGNTGAELVLDRRERLAYDHGRIRTESRVVFPPARDLPSADTICLLGREMWERLDAAPTSG